MLYIPLSLYIKELSYNNPLVCLSIHPATFFCLYIHSSMYPSKRVGHGAVNWQQSIYQSIYTPVCLISFWFLQPYLYILLSPWLYNWLGNRILAWRALLSFSHSVVSDSLRPHGLQHAMLPCPWPTPGAYSDSCPLSRWYHLTISSSSVIPFSSCLQSIPVSGFFLVSQFFVSGGQSIGASELVLPMNIQGWFPLELTGWISLQSKGLSRVFSKTTVQKHQFFGAQPSLWSYSHIHAG